MQENSDRLHADLVKVPQAPRLQPAAPHIGDPEHLVLPDPALDSDDDVDWQHEAQGQSLGPSAVLLWVLFWTWWANWGALVGIPAAMIYMIQAYLRAYLFEYVPVQFLHDLQEILYQWLEPTTRGPLWLWRLLFDDLE